MHNDDVLGVEDDVGSFSSLEMLLSAVDDRNEVRVA